MRRRSLKRIFGASSSVPNSSGQSFSADSFSAISRFLLPLRNSLMLVNRGWDSSSSGEAYHPEAGSAQHPSRAARSLHVDLQTAPLPLAALREVEEEYAVLVVGRDRRAVHRVG